MWGAGRRAGQAHLQRVDVLHRLLLVRDLGRLLDQHEPAHLPVHRVHPDPVDREGRLLADHLLPADREVVEDLRRALQLQRQPPLLLQLAPQTEAAAAAVGVAVA